MTNNMPMVVRKTYDGAQGTDLCSELFAKRRVFLQGQINSEMVMNIIMQMMYLVEDAHDEPISLYINSPGGEVSAGLMLYDFMQGLDTPVDIYCLGMVASMAAVLACSGEKGHRFILKHSEMMIHEPLTGSSIGGNATSIKHMADSILETKAKLNMILAEHTGKTVEEINEATAFDNVMSAEEAVKFGLVDEIVEKIM